MQAYLGRVQVMPRWSNNLAVIGLARGLRHKGDPRRHIVTSMVEHKAVLEGCEYLEKYEGYKVSYIKPHQDGSIDPELLASYLTEDTFLVSICHGNSVLGTVNDIHALALLCKDKGIYFHTDCAQTAGWEKTDFAHSAISMASLTPEKIYGPKGVGALYIKREANVPVEALIYGGGQEKGLRGGTVATHQVAAMGTEGCSVGDSRRTRLPLEQCVCFHSGHVSDGKRQCSSA